MIPNGYISVDCDGLDLTKGLTPQEIEGLYDRVIAAMNTEKPIFAINCFWGSDTPVTPIQTFALQWDDNTIIATASTLQVVVTSDDTVTIRNMVA